MEPNVQNREPALRSAGTPPNPPAGRKWTAIEIIGTVLLVTSMAMLFAAPETLSGLFDAIVDRVFPVVVDVFLVGEVGIAVVASVIVGRILERLGFTDAMIRLFIPIMRWIKVNPSVIIPSIYNILGDINAAGKIAGPILGAAGATKAEQKIAVATMVQSQQSFATFMIGLVALTALGIRVFPIIVLTVFVPLVLVPFILRLTIYRDTRAVRLSELPRFTPRTTFMKTFFDSSREGIELLLLVIIPAVAVVFAIIGILDYIGIWSPIESGMGAILSSLSIHPETGILSVLVSPTLAMAELGSAASIDPRLAVGSFVIASSGLPISVIFGQVPATWAAVSQLNEREAMEAAVIGIVLRFATAFLIGWFVTPLVI
jgi:hypothetical protein